MAKSRVTKVIDPTKGTVILQAKKLSTNNWPSMIHAFETTQVNVPTEIEGVEIPEITTNLISYVRLDLLSPETVRELQIKMEQEKTKE